MPRFPRLYVITMVLVLLCSASEVRSATETPIATQTGTAAWYGGKWIGRGTASGERYAAGDLTAAHRTLPFGTMVRVTNLKNQKSVVVKINNRGPWGKGRIIDVSERAATELAFKSAGTARVRLEVLTGDELAAATPSAPIAESPAARPARGHR